MCGTNHRLRLRRIGVQEIPSYRQLLYPKPHNPFLHGCHRFTSLLAIQEDPSQYRQGINMIRFLNREFSFDPAHYTKLILDMGDYTCSLVCF